MRVQVRNTQRWSAAVAPEIKLVSNVDLVNFPRRREITCD